jgi:pimeloyl-ACP methyl ester carboxylesterase
MVDSVHLIQEGPDERERERDGRAAGGHGGGVVLRARLYSRDLGGTAALYVGGSEQDPYEHRQIQATRERVPEARILAFPGGHLTTSEHPDLLAAAIRDIAERHGVGTPATASR